MDNATTTVVNKDGASNNLATNNVMRTTTATIIGNTMVAMPY